MKINIGDKIKLNEELLNEGYVVKINNELSVCTIKWIINDKEFYQLHYLTKNGEII